MSVKLGNTNIAGTQILYSTTGNNNDGAMTQAITTTQLNLKANDADVVHKTGNETIDGTKTFIQKIFSAPLEICGIGNTPKAYIDFHATGDFSTDYTSRIIENSAGVLNFDANKVLIPSSDTINAAISTTGINKSSNGYVKFGNGIIIQWGYISSSSANNQLTITFPTSFSNTQYKIILSQEYNYTGEYNANVYVRTKTNTGCNILGQRDYVNYIAIGY